MGERSGRTETQSNADSRLNRGRRRALLAINVLVLSGLAACSVPGTAPRLTSTPRFSPQQWLKTDSDHFVEVSQRRIFISLRSLAEKLYRRNPRQWRKTDAGSVEEAVSRIFDVEHGWRFEGLGWRRGIDALHVAFDPSFTGDRVQAFIVGLASMVQTAFGDKVGFYMLNDLDAQHFYNAARNVEIAAWKLATARHQDGRLLLLSNEMGTINNLSFEREFGRVIGILEVLTEVIEHKTERTVVRVVQNMATAVFLPLP